MFKKYFNLNNLSTLLLYLSILVFIIAFNFTDHGGGGWQQQFMPFLNNRPLADITFLDSLTGYAVTGDGISGNDTNYVLKTTDAGYNWSILLSKERDFRRVIFLNLDTGYVLHGDEILRTTNAGDNWSNMPVPPDNFGFYDMFPLSYDSMWICYTYIGGYYIYRTTNAGFSWVRQYQGNQVERIYMFNNNIGFAGGLTTGVLLKTTNSGINWTALSGNGFFDIYFADSLIGWKANGSMKKTTDGGMSWLNIPMPSGGNIINSSCQDFSVINKDSLWAVGGEILYPNNQIIGTLYRSTNGGINWQYQIPDTAIHLPQFYFSNFINKLNGWAYTFVLENSGVHTTIGGDTTFITNIYSENTIGSNDFKLYQNYPNPFNPKTKISYELEITSYVSIKIFDIIGKEIIELVNRKQNAGKYEIEFDGSGLTSGIYFYSFYIDSDLVDTKKMILLR